MNQIVTVARIAGEASKVVHRTFQRWFEARVFSVDEPTLVEPEQWPADFRAEMGQFAERIRANATQPPIVFWNEHQDMWSMGDVFQTAFPTNGSPLYEVESDEALSLLCYAIPDGNALNEHLGRELRGKRLAEETKWYLRVLQQAASAWHPLVEEAVIVVLRRVVGGLVTDDEVFEACHLLPNWLQEYNKA